MRRIYHLIEVDAFRSVLKGNVEYACNYIAEHFEGIEVIKPQGNYMLFLDCAKWCEAHGKTMEVSVYGNAFFNR